MLNKFIGIGRLTRDPEVKYLQSAIAVASFNLAVERSFKNKDGEKEADFVPIVVWRKTAELIEKYTTKGSLIAVSGRIQTRSYNDQDGNRRYITEVIADEIQFLSTNKQNSKPDTHLTIDDPDFDEVENDFMNDVPF